MGKKDDNHTERFNFQVTGNLAKGVKELKKLGYFDNNAEMGRASLPLLFDQYRKLGIKIGQVEKKED
jgi:hypothetical protein